MARRTRIILSSSILTTMFLGFLGWATASILKVPIIEEKISSLESSQKDTKLDIKETKSMIREIHWHLIKKNNVKIPKN